MKRWRWLLAVAIIGLVVAAAYVAGTSQTGADRAKPNEADAATYAYEAHDVVLRQMDGSGALQYEIEAASVTQLPKDGAIEAHDLTLHYDPPGRDADPLRRWTLTATGAQLPERSDIVKLAGDVQVRGRVPQSPAPIRFQAEQLDYNLRTQELSSDAAFELHWGGSQFSGRGLQANIKQGTVSVESGTNGKIVP
ncbi:MAG: LPS export ABC transporter periplasmic protein LptC [Proteobacteria bacterium]|jgi:LPS export ABC transporter protein LptC|nr:LPS export ABC transporter periplasmic protein LptC [Pseudomonadota bacterium]MBK7115146.1 LPS export ABC transporter periplasmic protein LptC [Pseudomonadota bacterium]MBK9252251.1 LPS export ABC transporter periplasmic protein LptC [Pseudomonadota bacterium]MCC6633544.1 LPS export ABC transporter periplasmic protein LptC [Gammaproteobacteria bacterium]